MRFAYSSHVRPLSFILVIVIGLLTVTPSPSAYHPAGQAALSIQALDVCSGSSAGIDLNLPYFIQECPCTPLPLLYIGDRNVPSVLFNPLLIPFQDERPPRA